MRVWIGFVIAVALSVAGCGDGGRRCDTDADCADGNQCTYDRCEDGRCAFPDRPDGTSCSRDCAIGSGQCEDGECSKCVLDLSDACSGVSGEEWRDTWLFIALGLVGTRRAARRGAAAGRKPAR